MQSWKAALKFAAAGIVAFVVVVSVLSPEFGESDADFSWTLCWLVLSWLYASFPVLVAILAAHFPVRVHRKNAFVLVVALVAYVPFYVLAVTPTLISQSSPACMYKSDCPVWAALEDNASVFVLMAPISTILIAWLFRRVRWFGAQQAASVRRP